MRHKSPKVLIIASFDPSCGAGAGADIKTVSSLSCYAVCAITTLTVQNAVHIKGILKTPSAFITSQIETILSDVSVDAVKIGALGGADSIRVIAKLIKKYKLKNIVADPVIKSSSGFVFMDKKAIVAYSKYLLPLTDVFTPNIGEAEIFARKRIKSFSDIKKTAIALSKLGPKNMIMKGGHFKSGKVCRDVLYSLKDKRFFEFSHKRVASANTHGTGCAFSSAMASFLAKGFTVQKATGKAGEFMEKVLKHSKCG